MEKRNVIQSKFYYTRLKPFKRDRQVAPACKAALLASASFLIRSSPELNPVFLSEAKNVYSRPPGAFENVIPGLIELVSYVLSQLPNVEVKRTIWNISKVET